jgi:hypothetical protein
MPRKTIGDVIDKMCARDVQDFISVRMVLQKKVDIRSFAAYSLAETAFHPATQATPHLRSRRETWGEFRQHWSDSEFEHLFRFSRRDVDILLPLFNINEGCNTHCATDPTSHRRRAS